jgi:hypothetical protein
MQAIFIWQIIVPPVETVLDSIFFPAPVASPAFFHNTIIMRAGNDEKVRRSDRRRPLLSEKAPVLEKTVASLLSERPENSEKPPRS